MNNVRGVKVHVQCKLNDDALYFYSSQNIFYGLKVIDRT